jgi:hypothetical protein
VFASKGQLRLSFFLSNDFKELCPRSVGQFQSLSLHGIPKKRRAFVERHKSRIWNI